MFFKITIISNIAIISGKIYIAQQKVVIMTGLPSNENLDGNVGK